MMSHEISLRRRGLWVAAACAIVAGTVLAGILWPRSANTHDQTVRGGLREKSASSILDEMFEAYRTANAYHDRADIRLQYRVGDQVTEEITVQSVQFQRPNRIRLEVSRGDDQITLACDGQTVHARVMDPLTNNFDGQIIVRSAPGELTLPGIYSSTEYVDPTQPTELLSVLLGVPIPLEFSAVGLLLSDEAYGKLRRTSSKLEQLTDETLRGRPCHRIVLGSNDGDFVFWIDVKTNALRRLEYPTNPLMASSAAAGIEYRDVSLTADFLDAEFAVAMGPEAFQMKVSADAKQVRNFVLPPGAEPSPLLGQHVGDFVFTDLDDNPVGADRWRDKFAVLVWFQDHPASRAALRHVEAVYQKYKDHGKIDFAAICTEPATAMSHQQIRSLTRNWGIDFPVVRDLDACGRDVFQIQRAPTLIVVSPDRSVEVVEEGVAANLNEQLPAVVDRLLAGDDIAAEFLDFAKKQRREYERFLASASVDTPVTEIAIEDSPVAEKSTPKSLDLTKLWTCDELTTPGNVFVVTEPDGQDVVYVHEGWRDVVSLGTDGNLRQRYQLTMPEDGAVSFVRTGTDHRGRRYFAATARLAQQLHVFDEEWKPVLRYPEKPQQHDGIQDIQLLDLDNDGDLELYVAFAGVVGVHRVDLAGNREWSNRKIHSVLSLEASPPISNSRQLLVASYHGEIVPLDALGQEGRPIAIGSRAIHHVMATRASSARPTMFCGMSFTAEGHLLAICIDQAMHEVFSYALPGGTFRTQIQYLHSGQVLDRAGYQWVMAGPDGLIHVVSDDGEFHDSWGYGQYITGLATAKTQDNNLLLVATDRGLTAWQVSRPSDRQLR